MNYAAWADWYDIFYSGSDPAELNFYHDICNSLQGPILEIGVGTGRVSLPLAQAGMEVVGIDLFEPMLRVAKRKALAVAPLNGSLNLIQADMRNFDLKRQFPVVIMPARTLLLATTEQDQLSTLCCAATHLTSKGTIAFNIFYPDPLMLAEDPEEEFLLEVVERPDGGRYVLTAKNHFDTVEQLNHGTQIVEELDQNGNSLRRQELDVLVRYLHPEQVIKLCDLVGLEILEMWGNFEGEELREESEEIVVLAKRSEYQISRT
tara:strand:- start:3041 stop:3826 length:786 start_codon:yes stop_codon:yes gene_type:complete